MSEHPNALILLDNGSLEPAATLNLRRLADALGREIGRTVHPVSLLHSHKVPAEQLEGKPAEIFTQAVRRLHGEGQKDILVVPLFFGPSGAIVDYLPEKITELAASLPGLRVRVAPWLVDTRHAGDERLTAILEDNIEEALADSHVIPHVILVDHGSPKPEVTAVRNYLAAELSCRLAGKARTVRAASMERRPEPEYDFTKPLLEELLRDPLYGNRLVVLSMLFLSPGRHAGPEGDIAQICKEAMRRNPCLQVIMTPLVGTHPGLIRVLADRYRQGLQGA
jgi:sirohydrochlorin ferrochelatase